MKKHTMILSTLAASLFFNFPVNASEDENKDSLFNLDLLKICAKYGSKIPKNSATFIGKICESALKKQFLDDQLKKKQQEEFEKNNDFKPQPKPKPKFKKPIKPIKIKPINPYQKKEDDDFVMSRDVNQKSFILEEDLYSNDGFPSKKE